MASDNGNGDSIDVKTPFFSTKIAGKNLTLRDIVLLLVFGGMIFSGVTLFSHAEATDKNTKELIQEVKQTNQTLIQTQKNIAFHQCKTACLLAQPPDRRDVAQCDIICAPTRQ